MWSFRCLLLLALGGGFFSVLQDYFVARPTLSRECHRQLEYLESIIIEESHSVETRCRLFYLFFHSRKKKNVIEVKTKDFSHARNLVVHATTNNGTAGMILVDDYSE
jgi:hypothetical protein